MAGKDFHANSFDQATGTKLDIYQSYLETWLPVFIQSQHLKDKINVFDFFAGPGRDTEGSPGSPLLFIDICKKFTGQLMNQKGKISLYFSDAKKKKMAELTETMKGISLPPTLKVNITPGEFKKMFMRNLKNMSGAANLLFIDQCGIKEVNKEVFATLVGLNKTDFIFFISSSSFKRFQDKFNTHVNTTEFVSSSTPHTEMHRSIASLYRKWIPKDQEYYLAPFSLKKGSNINGLVFGSANLLGILKFLEICWKLDPERGEANYDIDSDHLAKSGQPLDLFNQANKSRKLTEFEQRVEELLLNGKLTSDFEVFRYALESGFLPTKHAKPVVTGLIKSKKLTSLDGQPRLSKICIAEPRSFSLIQ